MILTINCTYETFQQICELMTRNESLKSYCFSLKTMLEHPSLADTYLFFLDAGIKNEDIVIPTSASTFNSKTIMKFKVQTYGDNL